MFTGIITNLGKISGKTDKTLIIKTNSDFLTKIAEGTSISVNGICLTIVNLNKQCFVVDFMPETKHRTNIKYLQLNDLVNLELPVTPSSFLSGHIVQGHIDGVSKLIDIRGVDNSKLLKFSSSQPLVKYILEKGSIAVNGISLTVIKVGKNYFTVGIIPYTWNNTMLKNIKPEDLVNIEVDILAKYVEGLLK